MARKKKQKYFDKGKYPVGSIIKVTAAMAKKDRLYRAPGARNWGYYKILEESAICTPRPSIGQNAYWSDKKF